MLSGRISVKLQMHAVRIVLSTREAIVFLDAIVSGH